MSHPNICIGIYWYMLTVAYWINTESGLILRVGGLKLNDKTHSVNPINFSMDFFNVW